MFVIRDMQNRLIKNYKALPIKKKLMLILSIIILIVSFFSFIVMQISFNIYNKQLINNSSEILNLYTTNIENELRKIDKLSFSILSDNKIQGYINTINEEKNSYARYYAMDSIRSALLNQSEKEKYISSISLVDVSENVYSFGNSVADYNESINKEILERVKKNAGGITWIEPLDGNSDFIAARKIRSLNNMNTIGILIIRIDTNSLIDWISKMSPQNNTNIIITSDTNSLIYKDNRLKIDDNSEVILKGKINKVHDINNKRYLINYGKSDYTKWNYIYLLPYENIFKGINIMNSILILSFIIIFIISDFIGISFTKGITDPIISLSKKMKKIQNGDFAINDIDKIPEEYCDEIGQLNNDFLVMADKIDILIKENYVKQILIKETQLKALQDQINPHFLYNTLNFINWEAKINKQYKISTMVNSLGNLFRNSINNKDNIIKVSEEISLVEDYISIQKIRFEERLDFKVNVDEDIKDCCILKLILQPIVENSIKYGLEYLTGVCEIQLNGFRDGDIMQIEVIDNGIGVSEEFIENFKKGVVESKGSGIGLKNIEERINLFFGEEYGLEINGQDNGGTIVKVRIPIKKL